MADLFTEATKWALKHPTRSENPDGTGAYTSWAGYCQSLMYRLCTAFGKAPEPAPISAKSAYRRTNIKGKKAADAPIGAFHFWTGDSGDLKTYGHVGLDLLGKGSTVLMGTSVALTKKLGAGIGTISVDAYTKKTDATYLGWGVFEANGYIARRYKTLPKPKTDS